MDGILKKLLILNYKIMDNMIKKYITFWIENGYEGWSIFKDNKIEDILCVIWAINIITSKEFIEAIARGLHKKNNYTDWIALSVDILTKEQAIAIRDWDLSNFINNLLPNG